MSRVELAQLNIARARAPLDEPAMDGFVSRLAEINALGEASPGFVWRLTDASGGDATGIRAYDDPLIIVNLTVWADIDELFAFAYRTRHAELFRARRDWFVPLGSPSLVLWWVPAGHRPTIAEARERLDHLAANGPTAHAFSLKSRFGPDAGAPAPPGPEPAPESVARP
ncbi:MAG TPA: DUF3291 domain-containing protein [Candidatus Limnocylindrales bacterium]